MFDTVSRILTPNQKGKFFQGEFKLLDPNHPDLPITKKTWEDTVIVGSVVLMAMKIAEDDWKPGKCLRCTGPVPVPDQMTHYIVW